MRKTRRGGFFKLYEVLVFFTVLNIVGREKFLDREAYAPEHRAGIILGRADAFLVGQAIVVSGDKQLR